VCAEAAMQSSVRNFVLVSTDKAVRPTSIMGTTKRLPKIKKSGYQQVQFENVAEPLQQRIKALLIG
jgi:FlaA1/EpsC-like NDP-sugar epimerase